MLDCLVFLNGHLLMECHDDSKFKELISEKGRELVYGDHPHETLESLLPFQNIYHWQLLENLEEYALHFSDPLHDKDRVDLVNSPLGKRETQFVSGTRYSITVRIET